jgi:hypothetical protein
MTSRTLEIVVVVASCSSDRAADTRGTVVAPTQTTALAVEPVPSASMVEVKADDAKAKGLPAIGVRVDPGTLSVLPFPEPDKYLIASGPPGGPLLAIVWQTDRADAIDAAVRAHFAQPWQQPLVVGESSTIEIAGAKRAALAFMTGESLRKTAWCGVLVGGASGAVLVTLGRAPGQAAAMTCAEVIAEPSLAGFVKTFALVP